MLNSLLTNTARLQLLLNSLRGRWRERQTHTRIVSTCLNQRQPINQPAAACLRFAIFSSKLQNIFIISTCFPASLKHPRCAPRKELQEKDERSLVGVTSRGGGSGKTVTLEEFGNDLTKVWTVGYGRVGMEDLGCG